MVIIITIRLGGQGDPLGIVQETEIWPYEQMVYAQTWIRPEEWDTLSFLGFWDTNRFNFSQRTQRCDCQQKMGTCQIVDFAVPADHGVKLKERRKRDKYLDLARELKKKLSNMTMTVIPIVIGVLGTIPKGLKTEIEDMKIRGQVETIQTTALLRLARILRKVLESSGDLMSLKLQWKTFS